MFFEMLFAIIISALIGAMAVICILGYLVATGDLVVESSEKRKAKRAERDALLKELMQKQVEKEEPEKEVETKKKK